MPKFAIRARWQNHTVKLGLTHGLVERGETTEGGAMYAGKIICALSSLVKDWSRKASWLKFTPDPRPCYAVIPDKSAYVTYFEMFKWPSCCVIVLS